MVAIEAFKREQIKERRKRDFPLGNAHKFSRNAIAASSFPGIYILYHLLQSLSVNNMKVSVLDLIMIILSDTFNTVILIMPSNGIWSRNYLVIKADACGNIYKKALNISGTREPSVIVSPFLFNVILAPMWSFLSLTKSETICDKFSSCFANCLSSAFSGFWRHSFPSFCIPYSGFYLNVGNYFGACL